MRKGFTLVELLIVIVVIVSLMAITFRLAGAGSNASHRNTTVQRLQRLENCLSGYFAAYGSYPPVALYATHNVYQHADEFGQQTETVDADLKWENVRAVCKAQPLEARFPFDGSMRPMIEAISKIFIDRCNSHESRWKKYQNLASRLGGGIQPLSNPNQVSGWNSKSTWEEVKIFKFGLMSYLLPRYFVMTRGLRSQDLDDCKQWTDDNELSAHPNSGVRFSSWEEQLRSEKLKKRIPSQAVCARWLPNLEKIVSCSAVGSQYFIYGVNIKDPDRSCSIDPDAPGNVEVYEDRTVLDSMTVIDGWGNDIYYYSPAPFQSYRLWSSGADGKTFPPWIPLNSLDNQAHKATASGWMADDIMFLNN